MDAATRAELDALRRRAYGPAADIHDDDDALHRLEELEERVVVERASIDEAPIAVVRPEAVDVVAAAAGEASVPPAPPSLAPPSPAPAAAPRAQRDDALRTRRAGFVLAAAAVVAVIGIIVLLIPRLAPDAEPAAGPTRVDVQAREAYSLTRDPDTEVLLNVPLDGSFGTYVDLPAEGMKPDFPTSGTIEWTAPLGNYYGWNLWIAGAAGALQREHCILIERDDWTRSRCVTTTLRSESALLVSVPYDLIEADERPDTMVDGERIGFWWGEDREVTVLLGPEYGG